MPQLANIFDQAIAPHVNGGLHALSLSTIQVNVGLKCNLECGHCHVVSSPRRSEEMSWDVMQHVLRVVGEVRPDAVDITGGAPEMHPCFRDFVRALREMGTAVQVRTNLTIFAEPGFDWIPDFLYEQKVRIVASLPCYLEDNVDKQRGDGVFRQSIVALKQLNALGYGLRDDLPLHLVYNPVGVHLPPAQAKLESDYRQRLREGYGIEFTGLYTIANMPIGRWRAELKQTHQFESYMTTLQSAFNPATLDGLMCRHQIEIGWDGTLYDCDFHLAHRLPVQGLPSHVAEFDLARHRTRTVATRDYCFGCTAGAGSSCGGALT